MKVNYILSMILLISVFSLFFMAYFSWKRSRRYVALSLIPIMIYAFGYAFEILCTNINSVKLWIKVEYIGISFLPLAWIMFVLNFTGYREKIKKRTAASMFIIPFIIIVSSYTNDIHHLFYIRLYMNFKSIFPIVEMIKGPLYWVNIAYTYVLMAVGLIILIRAYFNSVAVIRKQIILIIAAMLIPWISDIIYMFKLLNFDIDLSPFAFSFSAILYSFVVLKYKFLKLTPIALEKVFSSMQDGVIILDDENNLVDFNNSSKKIISELNTIKPGDKKINEAFKDYEVILKAINSGSCSQSIISIKNSEQLKYYRMDINNIYARKDKIIGKIIILSDVTESNKSIEKINRLLKLKEAMINIGYSINEISNVNDLLQLILDTIIDCVDFKICGSIMLLDETENLKAAVSKGYKKEDIESFKLKLQNAWTNDGGKIHKACVFNDVDKIKGINMLDTEEGLKIKSVISSPIYVDGKLYGFLNIDSIYSNVFDEGDLELMDYMSNQISTVVYKHKLYEQVNYLSRYDKLTNLYNRSYFEQLIHNNIFDDNVTKKAFLVVVFDLNNMKYVNDNYGHLAGDELIRTFSEGLFGKTGTDDIIGRIGGDEFVGIFFNIDAQCMIEKLEELSEEFIKNPIIYEGNKFACRFSYGAASFPDDSVNYKKLIKTADQRMYKYKSMIKEREKTIAEYD